MKKPHAFVASSEKGYTHICARCGERNGHANHKPQSTHSEPQRWTQRGALAGGTVHWREDKATSADVESVKAWLFDELGDDYADADAATQDARDLLARIFKEGEGRG